jgi:predicted dehydrogenase
MPLRKDWRIGTIGAGAIVRGCHLVAYRNAGFNPYGIASLNRANARMLQMNLVSPTFMIRGNNC